MPRVARPTTHQIAVLVGGQPGKLIVARDLQTGAAALFLNNPFTPAIALSPKAHADLLQALSFPPCPGVANAKPDAARNTPALPPLYEVTSKGAHIVREAPKSLRKRRVG